MSAEAPAPPPAPPLAVGDAEALRALGHYDGLAGSSVRLLSVSENATYLVEPPDRAPLVLRLNRPGYHSKAAIESELAWVRALRADRVVSTPPVVPTSTGEMVAVLERGPDRHAVLFEHVAGAHPAEESLLDGFCDLGRLTARLHRHAREWGRPAWFTRMRWDSTTALGPAGHWGRWQAGMQVGPAECDLLGRAVAEVTRRVDAYGTAEQRFGLVHADMRLANLLVQGDDVTVIDFDDCGMSWYLYDLAASLSFLEHRSEVPELIELWLRGYRQEAEVSPEDEAVLPSFVMLRRILLVAWIGSHAETEQAQAMGPGFTSDSCELAERYLSSGGTTLWR